MKRIIFITVFPVFLLSAGCTSDLAENEADGLVPIRFTSNIEVATRAAYPDTDAGPIPSGAEVAVHVRTPDYKEIYPRTVMTSDGTGSLTGGPAMYFPKAGNVEIISLAPASIHNSEFAYSTSTTLHIQRDQTGREGYVASDFMVAAARDVAKTSSPVALTYYHMLSKLRVAIMPEGVLTASDLEGASVEICQVPYYLYFNHYGVFKSTDWSDPSQRGEAVGVGFGINNKADISIGNDISTGFNSADVKYNDAVLIPQTVEAGKTFLRITLADGVEYTWAPPADLVFETGKRYSYNVKIHKEGLDVSAVTADWEEGYELQLNFGEEVVDGVYTLPVGSRAATLGFTVTGNPKIVVVVDVSDNLIVSLDKNAGTLRLSLSDYETGEVTVVAVDHFDRAVSYRLTVEPYARIVPESYSYMLEPGGQAILIPISRAQKATNSTYNLGADASGLRNLTASNYVISPLWSDLPVGEGGVIEDIRAQGEYVYVKPGVAGNAVFSIVADTYYTRWSWHIWVTEPVSSATDRVTGLTWMDRNLGAAGTTYDPDGRNGLYYQWGRKDAFPAGDGAGNNQVYYKYFYDTPTTEAIGAGTLTTMSHLAESPFALASNSQAYFGSLGQAGYQNNSWGAVSGQKTIYDPCPPGWKVPPFESNGVNSWGSETKETWSGFAGNGRIFHGVDGIAGLAEFYPANGNRGSNGVSFEGTTGYYWSASSHNAHTGYSMYYINATIQNPARSIGLSVRCVAE